MDANLDLTRLRAALAYYTTATYVSSWGMQETEDDGGVAREALAATAAAEGSELADATAELLRAVAVAAEAERVYITSASQATEAYAEGGEHWRALAHQEAEACQARYIAVAEVERLRALIRSLLAATS